MTEQNQDKPQLPDAEAVAAYLRAHPEFFVDHDELILELRIPHQPGTAVSLVERQVKLLRERNIEVRHRLSHLMDVARDNDRLFDKTRRLVLDLLDANSLERYRRGGRKPASRVPGAVREPDPVQRNAAASGAQRHQR